MDVDDERMRARPIRQCEFAELQRVGSVLDALTRRRALGGSAAVISVGGGTSLDLHGRRPDEVGKQKDRYPTLRCGRRDDIFLIVAEIRKR